MPLHGTTPQASSATRCSTRPGMRLAIGMVLACVASCADDPTPVPALVPPPSSSTDELVGAPVTRLRVDDRERISRIRAHLAKSRIPELPPLVDPVGIRGQVVDERTGLGVEGWRVRLTHEKRRFESTSGPDGQFVIHVPRGEDGVRVWVHPRRDWRWRSDSIRNLSSGGMLTQPQRSGAESLHLKVAEKHLRQIHGVAVDETTRAPLPSFSFRVTSSNRGKKEGVTILTDEEGRFATSDRIWGGKLEVRPGAGEGWPVEREFDLLHDGEPLTLAFDAGPRLTLKLVGHAPVDPSGLQFAIARRGQHKLWAETHLRVEPTGEVWVRTPLPRNPPAPGEQVSLFVMDQAGYRLGHQQATWASLQEATRTTPLVVPMERTGAIRVEALQSDVDPDDKAYRLDWGEHARVQLAMPGVAFPGAQWRLAAMRWLPTGTAVVSARARAYESFTRKVEVMLDTTREVQLTLSPNENLRRVTGSVRSESGKAFARANVTITLEGNVEASWNASHARGRWCGTGVDHGMRVEHEAGVQVARFEFERVPAGPLTISANSSSGPCTVEVHESSAGDVEIVVVIRDADSTLGFGFHVTDAESRAALTFGHRVHSMDGGLGLKRWGGGLVGSGDPRERSFEWAVFAGGKRPVYGTQAAFKPGAGGNFWAAVALEQGWGTRVRVLSPDGRASPGAAVSLDGVEAGITNQEGWVEVGAPEEPLGIEVRSRTGETVVLIPSFEPWMTAKMRLR